MSWNIKRRRRSERGAVTVLFAILVVVIFAVAALGVDLAQQVNRKHLLVNQLDSAATAAAASLGAENGSIAAAVDAAADYFANSGQGELDLDKIDFWCVVARKLNGDNTPFNPAMVATAQIPTPTQAGGICNPDSVGGEDGTWRKSLYQNRPRSSDGQPFSMSCSDTLCAVPCALQAKTTNNWNPGNSSYNNRPIKCNTIRVGAEQDVPFSLAGVMGINEGSTGSQISVACAGSCGSVAPNPMDVVVVADRTRSMIVGGHDYREDLVAGIKGMLQVMTPEQQFVSLGALGPSMRTRATSETKTCTDNSTSGRGLVFPSDVDTIADKGTWVPVSFKKDYLGTPDANGLRAVNTSSKLIQAVNCLDDFDPNTRTALASPLKGAARYLLGKPGDENNVSALGGGDRSGTVKKVIIFETDGQPWEHSATTAGTVTLDNDDDIFSYWGDHSATTTTTSGPVLGSVTSGRPSYISRPSQCPSSGSQCTYQYRTNTTTKTDTLLANGGQKACQNFKQVAALAKAQGILIITIGYNLNGSTMCSGNNSVSLPDPDTVRGTHYISNITPTSCRASGSGTPADPYVPKSSCTQTITWTVPQTTTTSTSANASGDASVTDTLADASGGADVPAGQSNGCANTSDIAAENADEDLFFCAARGDDLAPLFITALSKVTKGVKLMNLP